MDAEVVSRVNKESQATGADATVVKWIPMVGDYEELRVPAL